ncbi:dihydroneopterin aldolase [Cognatishimia sp. SS12]|uniref:dihydroneopterin aldolase n=1 Tax=Cognatishimia sp. SS12 TaxID=2979465 RepID=UPI00232B04D3|nr:dihydroneopterin aldolase [Cognatishimia sp. SS12]MDC0738096.1 dihydroneopterin aldolase [Cognatishimia sp. SS12]
MTDEISNAFAHPEARAAAMPVDGVHDRLSLRDHIVSVEIGAFQAERDMTQRLAFDIVVDVAAPAADLGDDVDQILSYDRLIWAIEEELAAERLNLLETLAERIADRILREPLALRVFVRIHKLDKGNGKLGVEIMRVAAEQAAAPQEATGPRAPKVVFLSGAALASDHLGGWIAQLCGQNHPLVLTLEPPENRPRAATAAAQRHVDLLAVEQRAWQLVAEHPALTVAATRTELDWAMKNALPVVWAPAKLVLDATDEPPQDFASLALWFAELWGADHALFVGKTPPVHHTIATQVVTVDQSQL